MGENFWPYGIEENRKSLETLTRYVHEQGLTSRQVAVDELFAAGTRTQVKV
jgi:4,5-dihydroxyphthalate decarboxylase